MPKAEVGSTKWLGNKIKSKGLQRLRWWCEYVFSAFLAALHSRVVLYYINDALPLTDCIQTIESAKSNVETRMVTSGESIPTETPLAVTPRLTRLQSYDE